MRQIKHTEEKSKVARLFVVLVLGLFAFLLLSLVSRVAYAQTFTDDEIRQWWENLFDQDYDGPQLGRNIASAVNQNDFQAKVFINKADTYGYIYASDNYRWNQPLAEDNRVSYTYEREGETITAYYNKQQSIEWMSTPLDGKWEASLTSSWGYKIADSNQTCSSIGEGDWLDYREGNLLFFGNQQDGEYLENENEGGR